MQWEAIAQQVVLDLSGDPAHPKIALHQKFLAHTAHHHQNLQKQRQHLDLSAEPQCVPSSACIGSVACISMHVLMTASSRRRHIMCIAPSLVSMANDDMTDRSCLAVTGGVLVLGVWSPS